MSKVLDHIPTPGLTLSGKTSGPAVALGRCRVGRGMPLYLHADELRQAVRDMGWPLPEHHQELADKLEQAHARIVELEAQVAEQAEAVEAAAAALRAKFSDQPKPVHTGKHPRKNAKTEESD